MKTKKRACGEKKIVDLDSHTHIHTSSTTSLVRFVGRTNFSLLRGTSTLYIYVYIGLCRYQMMNANTISSSSHLSTHTHTPTEWKLAQITWIMTFERNDAFAAQRAVGIEQNFAFVRVYICLVTVATTDDGIVFVLGSAKYLSRIIIIILLHTERIYSLFLLAHSMAHENCKHFCRVKFSNYILVSFFFFFFVSFVCGHRALRADVLPRAAFPRTYSHSSVVLATRRQRWRRRRRRRKEEKRREKKKRAALQVSFSKTVQNCCDGNLKNTKTFFGFSVCQFHVQIAS